MERVTDNHLPAADDDRRPGLSAHSPAPAPPVTGDRAVDEALTALVRTLDGSPAERVEALTEAHRSLQARLTSPSPVVGPADARPGPPRA